MSPESDPHSGLCGPLCRTTLVTAPKVIGAHGPRRDSPTAAGQGFLTPAGAPSSRRLLRLPRCRPCDRAGECDRARLRRVGFGRGNRSCGQRSTGGSGRSLPPSGRAPGARWCALHPAPKSRPSMLALIGYLWVRLASNQHAVTPVFPPILGIPAACFRAAPAPDGARTTQSYEKYSVPLFPAVSSVAAASSQCPADLRPCAGQDAATWAN